MIYNVSEFLEGPYKVPYLILKNGYISIPSGFDIETTQVDSEDKGHKAYMYIWQMAVGDDVIIGRRWADFLKLLNYLGESLELSEGKRLLCYIHNMSFEFSFFKNLIKWAPRVKAPAGDDIFFLNPREPIKALTWNYIEFRDSQTLTGMSLKELAKHYTKTQKLVGDLDYRIKRNSYTALTDEELRYCINDAVICKEFGEYILQKYPEKVPLTKTSIVRNICKDAFKGMCFKKDFSKFIYKAFPYDQKTYEKWMRWLYQGGWVHANFCRAGELFRSDNMRGFDFKSSYPDECTKPLPGRFKKISPKKEYLDKWIKKTPDFVGFKVDSFSMIIEITVKELSIKTSHSVFSKHKLMEHSGKLYLDNGRVRYSDECKLLLTNYDYCTLLDFYDFSEIKIHELWIAKNELLPDFFLETLYSFYNAKNVLEKDTLDYMLSKQNLNALYGMMCTGLIKVMLTYSKYTGIGENSGYEKSFNAIKSQQWMLPQWGIWVSAGARRKLLKLILQFGDDASYGDTDSCKLDNYKAHLDVIKQHNEETLAYHRWLKEMTGFDFGKLGIFDDEGAIKRFKTLGCKRYIYQDRLYNTHVVIAGLPKGRLETFAIDQGKDIFEVFDNQLFLSTELTNKLTSSYSDHKYSDVIIDDQGHSEVMHEDSGVCLFNVPFNMKLATDYASYIKECVDKHKYQFGIRGI